MIFTAVRKGCSSTKIEGNLVDAARAGLGNDEVPSVDVGSIHSAKVVTTGGTEALGRDRSWIRYVDKGLIEPGVGCKL